MIIPFADNSYAPVIWLLVDSAFPHHFVLAVTILAAQKSIHML